MGMQSLQHVRAHTVLSGLTNTTSPLFTAARYSGCSHRVMHTSLVNASFHLEKIISKYILNIVFQELYFIQTEQLLFGKPRRPCTALYFFG